jgi:uncharacterized iron-regulated membrane protein
MHRRALRKLFHGMHKWLGLSIGLLFALLGMTGSLLTFYPELQLALHPEIAASSPGTALNLGSIVDALRQAEPARHGAWRIELPRQDNAPVTARYYKPAETAHRGFAPLIVTIDPANLSISSRHFWGDDFFTWIYDLHYSLLLGDNGKTLLGAGSIFIAALLLIGLYLWWPHPGHWLGALAIKPGAVWKRRVYDLHVKPGVYGLLLTLTLTLSGLLLVVPGWFTPAIDSLSPLTPYFRASPAPTQDRPQISADEAANIALGRFPAADIRWIETPSDDIAVWRIQLRQDGEPSRRFPRTNVWIDAHSGQILAIRNPRQNSAGDTLMDWLHPLHNGEAFGLTGRIIVFLCGFLPLLALVTGILRWRHKTGRRAKGHDQHSPPPFY